MTSFNLADLFESVADAVPDREALVCGDRRLTYRQLDERATRLADHLLSHGVKKGDHIGLYLYNGTEYIEGSLAAYKIGAAAININYRYVEEELEYLFDNADLVALIHHREFAPRIAAVAEKMPKLRTFVFVDDDSNGDYSLIGSTDYEGAVAGASAQRSFAARSADDVYILYTGGTTGMPKGVMWRHEDLFFSALMGANPYGPPPETPEQVGETAAAKGVVVSLPAAPLMHGAAQWATFINLYGGGKTVLTKGKSFDPRQVWRLVEQEKVNTIAIVGDAMGRPLAEALEEPGASYDLSSLRVIGSGGATFSEPVKDHLKKNIPNLIVMDNFGGSEGGAQGQHVGRGADGTAPRFRATPDTAVLSLEEHRPIEPGTGEVGWLARRGRIPLGYYKDEAKTAATFVTVDGVRWALPGDYAMVEADGTITLLGRGSACINSGGEKIYPEEVEAAVRSHPGVFDAVVVGVPDERWGERVTAVVQPRPGANVTLEQLDRHCREHVSGYKVPRGLTLVDELVRQPSGKPDYRWAKSVAMGGGGS
jgi:acyl-CoA synthetase (AMP-forming)/AMP-acid ligase II